MATTLRALSAPTDLSALTELSAHPLEREAAVRMAAAERRALRFLDALGEFIAALVLIAGGSVLVGLATLV